MSWGSFLSRFSGANEPTYHISEKTYTTQNQFGSFVEHHETELVGSVANGFDPNSICEVLADFRENFLKMHPEEIVVDCQIQKLESEKAKAIAIVSINESTYKPTDVKLVKKRKVKLKNEEGASHCSDIVEEKIQLTLYQDQKQYIFHAKKKDRNQCTYC
jgi:aspartate carbamoyltransferase catalytic subunit